MKTEIVYGVEMTEIENMIFSKFLSNNGIAMNTMTESQRTECTQLWLNQNRII